MNFYCNPENHILLIFYCKYHLLLVVKKLNIYYLGLAILYSLIRCGLQE